MSGPAPLTGTQVQDNLLLTARQLGYLAVHFRDVQRSEPGFPDVCIAGHGACFVWECKSKGEPLVPPKQTKKGRLLPGQQDWLDAFAGVVTHAGVVRDDAESPDELSLTEAYDVLETARFRALSGLVHHG